VAFFLTDGLSSETRKQFLALQLRYVAGLNARWIEISGAPDLQAMQQKLHQLAGSAGSYGFEPLGLCAADAEKLAFSGASAALAQALVLVKAEIDLVRSEGVAE
jgi:HPt (histidine-containing phosphotransfer) domain-containing protein